MPSNRITVLTFGCLLAALFGLCWLAYHPGLSGTFLFDDYVNLPSLGEFGPVDNAATFWRYLTSGSADPLGRPLALLSFLIDANDWPAAPYAFKRTGVLFHLLNGMLLCWLLLKLGRVLGKAERQAALAAVIGAAFWMLHPLLVSTTLYVVQRETILPATFILIGLLGYVGGRTLAIRGNPAGTVLAAISIGACTLLAMLCKANGALLPLLAWIVDAVLLGPQQPIESQRTRRSFAIMGKIVLVTPSLLLFAFLAKLTYGGLVDGLPAIRPWTLGERLLTESRILVDYLKLLWLPRPFTAGLFNDGFAVSTGLLSPVSTLLSLLFIAALLAGAWTKRRAYPALALAVLFYFAGQLLESTVVPLELYFEHRNYAPALLLFWPLSLWLCAGQSKALPSATASQAEAQPLMRGILAVVLVLGLAFMTFLGASLWGNVDDQALLWAVKNPGSPRAQAYAAQIELQRGQVEAATRRLEYALAVRPGELQLSLNLIGAKCQAQALTSEDIGRAEVALRSTPNTGRLGYDWFEKALVMATNGNCPGLDLQVIESLLNAAGENQRTEKVPGRVQDRLHLQGRIALLRGDGERALELFNAALDADMRPGAALQQAAVLASAHHPDLAQRHLDHLTRVWHPVTAPGLSMPSIHAWLLWKQGYWENEIAHLRKVLAEDVEQEHMTPASQRQGQY